MSLPRTPQPQRKTAPTPIQRGHRTKKQRKADEAEEADELAKERRKQGNVSPDLSKSLSDNATFQTLAGVVCGGQKEREADQTKKLNPPGRTAPPTPTTDPPDVTTRDPTTTTEGLLGEESRSRSTSLPDDAQDDGGSRSTDGNDNRESFTATSDRQTGFAGTQRYQTPGFSQPGLSYQNPGSQQLGKLGKARQTDHSQLAQSSNSPQGPDRPE
jgi:hypothetical protein